MDLKIELTFEQQFSLRKYEGMLDSMSPEEKDKAIIDLLRQVYAKDNLIKQFMKKVMENEQNGLQKWLAENTDQE